MRQWLMGMDDTDNLESRGTGHMARHLAATLASIDSEITIRAITRHQLLVDPRIPYTSHNSSACIRLDFSEQLRGKVINAAEEHLIRESADGSDVGLCVAELGQVSDKIKSYGISAKNEILNMALARELAVESGFHLQGLTGTYGGIIGALAAVGLHAGGSDGRFLWLPGLRELSGIYTIAELKSLVPLDEVRTEAGMVVPPVSSLNLESGWARPLLLAGKAVLLVEPSSHGDCDWSLVGKERIKALSN